NITRRAFNLFEVAGWGAVNGAFTAGDNYYSLQLPHLPLKTHFKIHEGILYPKFSAKEEPVIAMEWKIPQDMNLVLLCAVKSNTGGCACGKQWLVAFDHEKRTYRLPLGN